jgi:hypothetical protein
MIEPQKIKKSQALHIIELIEQITRAEIMARFGPFDTLEYAEYFSIKVRKEDELRKYLFGSSNLVKLGIRWGLLKERTPNRRKRKRKK